MIARISKGRREAVLTNRKSWQSRDKTLAKFLNYRYAPSDYSPSEPVESVVRRAAEALGGWTVEIVNRPEPKAVKTVGGVY
jgi:hypothetical protein